MEILLLTMFIAARASERKVEMISTSTPSRNSTGEKIVYGNKIVDMEILSPMINMLICPSCRKVIWHWIKFIGRREGLHLFYHFSAFAVNIQLKLILQIDALQTKIPLMWIAELLTVRELVGKAMQD